MTASNLAICVGQSLLWTQDPSYMMDQNYSKEVSSLIQVLIEDYPLLFSEDVPSLFVKKEGDDDDDEEEEERVEAGPGRTAEDGPGAVERTSSGSSAGGKTKTKGSLSPSVVFFG